MHVGIITPTEIGEYISIVILAQWREFMCLCRAFVWKARFESGAGHSSTLQNPPFLTLERQKKSETIFTL